MPEASLRHASASTQISNGLSKLHREFYGRGPNSVRTVFGHDHVVTFLEDIYTPLERTLVEGNEIPAVVEVRRAFQRTMKDKFITVVEEATGRTVRAFLSEVSVAPDISVEVFVLERIEPDPDPAPEGVG
ncbi:MAG TPA: Na-translocating system protein MpsC family protein [Gaiellaceae bacterium]|jgi:uncharacterized protein YbcI|nr:Na-translocating system protein MpsC family protein [Gaiellaceae bacterium]